MRKFETDFKLKIVEQFLAGEGGAKLLARRWSVPEEKVRTWVSHYQRHGVAGLQPKRSSYTAEFKLQVLAHQDREHVSNRQLAAIYDIRNANQIVVWRRTLERPVGPATAGKWKACPMKAAKKDVATPDPDSGKSHRALLDEIERLRLEVAYLKKLEALVRTNRQAARKERKPFSS